MENLLSAHLFRMKRDRLLWIALGAVLFIIVFTMLEDCRQAARLELVYGVIRPLDQYYFKMAPAVGICLSVYASLFLGTEHRDGVLRTKMLTGHSRPAVYLAGLAACSLAALAMLAAALLGGLAGVPSLGLWQGGLSSLIVRIFILAGSLLSLASLFTVIGTLSTRRSTAAVLSVLLYLGLLMAACLIYSRLTEPETVVESVLTVQGVQTASYVSNPKYVGGWARALLETIMDILPTGQAVLLANSDTRRPVFQLAASVICVCLTTAAGCVLFRRKDLK